ncbi:hypothetical protein HanHA300_Chr14g0540581 [Helianthus annuus]|nr:hypothetical protein HanHA300_Chr14g0540581 [Helianthus annuus]KAJ0487247.1 hypothetical protein HanHA89_Chr14g0588351 [Helianthus annuus]
MLMMMTMSDEVDGGGTGPPQAVLGTTGSGGNDGGVLVLDSGFVERLGFTPVSFGSRSKAVNKSSVLVKLSQT